MYSIFTSTHLSVADEVGRDVMVADPTIHVAVFTITEHGGAYDYCPYKPLLSLFYSVYIIGWFLLLLFFLPFFLVC
jgi:uncharacterized membrane protein